MALAQNTVTVNAVSQIGDGQVQAPTGPQPSAPSAPSSAPYENPFTIYTDQTNSWGVITGMPSMCLLSTNGLPSRLSC
jgi:hypothetical protein